MRRFTASSARSVRWKVDASFRIQSRSCSVAADPGQQQPWVVSAATSDFESRAADSVLKHGFVIVPKLFDQDGLAGLKMPIMEQADKVLSMLNQTGANLGVGSANGFHEICLRSPGRKDIPCSPETALADSVATPLEHIADRVFASNMSQQAAGKNAVRAYMGIVRGEPGCPAQLWHADSPHLSGDHEAPNMLNMLVSLADCPVELGPTELLPESHVLTNHHRPDAAFGEHSLVYQRPENSPELIGSKQAPVVAEMTAGSVLIFDDRLLHRGGGNQSTSNRDLAFLTYHRPGYTTPTYYEAARSLENYNHHAMPETVRKEFPALKRCAHSGGGGDGNADGSGPVILADGASGSQFHQTVVDGMVEQMTNGIANMGGNYDSSRHAEKTMVAMRSAMSDFLNCSADEVVFGASMSALTYHVAKALHNSELLKPGDNIVLDPMSHGANVWAWVQLAKATGAEVRWLQIGEGLVLNSEHDVLSKSIDEKTRFVAVGYASNGVGSVHDVKAICAAAKHISKGAAMCYVDATHYAPHGRVDVQDIACDFLACSPYKFFGPHSGILYGRKNLLQSLSVDRLDVQDDGLPEEANCWMSRWEVGTQNYEAAAGIVAAVDYLAGLGDRFGGADSGTSRQTRLDYAFHAIAAHESELKRCFIEGIDGVRGLHLVGVTDPAMEKKRTATFAVAKDGLTAEQLTNALCERNIWCTYGNHYAGFWGDHSGGLTDNDTGMTRLGFLHYNTVNEIREVVRVLADL